MDWWAGCFVGFILGGFAASSVLGLSDWARGRRERARLELEEAAAKAVKWYLDLHCIEYHQPNTMAKDCPCASPKKR